MIKYFLNAFKITNENIILTTPLVLFLLLLSIYLGIAKNAPDNIASFILLLITIVFMISAFFAGWLFMVKKAISISKIDFIIDEDKSKASFNLIKEFPIGIGEYFLPFLVGIILYTALFFSLLFIGFQIGVHFIGKIGLGLNELKASLASPASMKVLVSSLSKEQLIKLNAWNFLLLIIMSIFSFITMFWPAELVTKTKNAFVALFNSVKFTFKNFLAAIIIFIYISVINFIVSLINAFAAVNPITYFISLLVYFYFLVYVVVLIFLYYDSKNTTKTENISNSGTDGNGQEQISDTEGKSD